MNITITTKAPKVDFKLSGSGTATIDWGDGSPETIAVLHWKSNFNHEFNGDEIHTIIINGDDIIIMMCHENGITSLDVSNNTVLQILDCSNNEITCLDVSKSTALIKLDCSNNKLTSLDISKNTEFIELNCSSNQITSLDVSKNTDILKGTSKN